MASNCGRRRIGPSQRNHAPGSRLDGRHLHVLDHGQSDIHHRLQADGKLTNPRHTAEVREDPDPQHRFQQPSASDHPGLRVRRAERLNHQRVQRSLRLGDAPIDPMPLSARGLQQQQVGNTEPFTPSNRTTHIGNAYFARRSHRGAGLDPLNPIQADAPNDAHGNAPATRRRRPCTDLLRLSGLGYHARRPPPIPPEDDLLDHGEHAQAPSDDLLGLFASPPADESLHITDSTVGNRLLT